MHHSKDGSFWDFESSCQFLWCKFAYVRPGNKMFLIFQRIRNDSWHKALPVFELRTSARSFTSSTYLYLWVGMAFIAERCIDNRKENIKSIGYHEVWRLSTKLIYIQNNSNMISGGWLSIFSKSSHPFITCFTRFYAHFFLLY